MHMAACEDCQRTIAAAVPVDLSYVWSGVTAELDAPAPGLIERALTIAGVDPWLARYARTSPALRPSWLLASAALVAAAALMARLPSVAAPFVMLLAPFLSAVAVSLSFGRLTDPAREIVAVTPVSPLTTALIRLAAVLVTDSVLLLGGDLLAGHAGPVLGWFLPMTATAMLSALTAARYGPVAGAVAGGCTWLAVVLAMTGRGSTLELFGLVPQLCYAALAAVLLVLILARARSWPAVPRAAAR